MSRLHPFRVRHGLLFPLLAGAGVAAFTFGALSERVSDRDDLLSAPHEALLLGLAFALASSPTSFAIIGRALLFIPTFFLYLNVFTDKPSPLPFAVAVAAALFYALAFTALSADARERLKGLTEQFGKSLTINEFWR